MKWVFRLSTSIGILMAIAVLMVFLIPIVITKFGEVVGTLMAVVLVLIWITTNGIINRWTKNDEQKN